jgi:endonuclease/exonuclease/phosphatase family metal-dependent hydrolase
VVVRRREGGRIGEHDAHRQYSKRLLVRTWNLFHGNTLPPGRRAFLDEMVGLLSADAPDIVCLQELPIWSLPHLTAWSGMAAVSDVAQRARLGIIPIPPQLGRAITSLDHGLFRSAFTGQANALLIGADLAVVEHRHLVLNPFRFRRAQARRLGLDRAARLRWAKERRGCQAVRLRRGDRTCVVANLHATSLPRDRRVPDAELLRAASFVDGMALPGEPVLLCGDFNVSVRNSRTLVDLMSPEWGFAGPTPTGIDHILVRGLGAGEPRIWPPERRLYGGRLLSDHAPVEVETE